MALLPPLTLALPSDSMVEAVKDDPVLSVGLGTATRTVPEVAGPVIVPMRVGKGFKRSCV